MPLFRFSGVYRSPPYDAEEQFDLRDRKCRLDAVVVGQQQSEGKIDRSQCRISAMHPIRPRWTHAFILAQREANAGFSQDAAVRFKVIDYLTMFYLSYSNPLEGIVPKYSNSMDIFS